MPGFKPQSAGTHIVTVEVSVLDAVTVHLHDAASRRGPRKACSSVSMLLFLYLEFVFVCLSPSVSIYLSICLSVYLSVSVSSSRSPSLSLFLSLSLLFLGCAGAGSSSGARLVLPVPPQVARLQTKKSDFWYHGANSRGACTSVLQLGRAVNPK